MAPKKRNAKSGVQPSVTGQPDEPIDKPAGKPIKAEKGKASVKSLKGTGEEDATKQPSKKRKVDADAAEPQKAQRRSGRSTDPKPQPSQEQLLRYMLSKDAEELCRPDDETEDIKARGDIRTYSSSLLNPYEELLCAIILSRPISHRLGLRTIRTVLNDPYNFTSARATQDAGPEKQHQALWDARTQHKDKTADQIGELAKIVLEKFSSEDDAEGRQLQKVRDDCDKDVPKEREYLKSNIKGLGKTGLDIFFRRVQWTWTAGYPFVDDRTAQALRKLGLPENGDDLHDLIEQHWAKLDTEQLAVSGQETKKRRAFVVVLERATGSDLERKQDVLLEAAAAL